MVGSYIHTPYNVQFPALNTGIDFFGHPLCFVLYAIDGLINPVQAIGAPLADDIGSLDHARSPSHFSGLILLRIPR